MASVEDIPSCLVTKLFILSTAIVSQPSKDSPEIEIFQICQNSGTVAVIPAKSKILKSEIPAEIPKLNM
ncbi:unnamed protein product [Rhizophagus irregularis]|nr:unnamed protein product [Rhizophagus irregularis]